MCRSNPIHHERAAHRHSTQQRERGILQVQDQIQGAGRQARISSGFWFGGLLSFSLRDDNHSMGAGNWYSTFFFYLLVT